MQVLRGCLSCDISSNWQEREQSQSGQMQGVSMALAESCQVWKVCSLCAPGLAALEGDRFGREHGVVCCTLLGSGCHRLSIHREVQQVTADVPQPPCYCHIPSLGGDPRHMAVTEMIPA